MATDAEIIAETRRRVLLKDAQMYTKEATRLRASAFRLVEQAKGLERDAEQNISVAESMVPVPVPKEEK
jgi:hypothetical protein